MCCKPRFSILSLMLLILAPVAVRGQDLPITSTTVVRFASLEEARALLGASDAFTQAMSPFDRQIRMRCENDAGEAGFRAFATAQAREWTEAEAQPVRHDLDLFFIARTRQLKLSLPPRILLVRSTGAEECGLPYTRGAAIVIPQTFYNSRTLVHELFHVMSRHDPALRSHIFAAIGFTRCEPITLTPALEAIKITNPDSPLLDHVIELTVEDQDSTASRKVMGVPVMRSREEEYDASLLKGNYMPFIQNEVLEVERAGRGWRLRLTNGEPVAIKGRTDYVKLVGRITHTMVQPEEIAACNFEQFFFFPQIVDSYAKQFKLERATTATLSVRTTLELSQSRSKIDAITSATQDRPAQLTLMETMETLLTYR